MAHRRSLSEARYNLRIQQGATFRETMTWIDKTGAVIPLAACDAWLHVRETPEDDDILLELTADNGGIVLADTSPNITLYLSDEDTALITGWTKGEFDLLIEFTNGDRRRLFRGEVTVSPASTRDVP